MSDRPRRARRRTAIDPPRQAAYDVLRQVDDVDAYLNLTLTDVLAERGLTGRDAAFTTELAAGTARMQGSYLAVLESIVAGGTGGLQPEVRTALVLGAHQVLGMRVPAHAAVGTTVELVRDAVGERPVRLVNAVMRRLGTADLDDWLAQVAPDPDVDAIGSLSVRHSHPRWIVEVFVDLLGRSEAELALAADNEAPTVTLAARPGLATAADLVAAGAAPGRWSPYAAVLPGGDPGALETVRRGTAGVQDEGSQLAALALARAVPDGRRDQRWLDLCAGPGGKAALLRGLAGERGADLVANERLPHRAGLVRSSLRAYPDPKAVVAGDGRAAPWRPETFDRVLADVPCTGLGALRRRPESRWRRQPSDLETLVPLQRTLLTSAVESVRPGGVVAYVTCSPHPDETTGIVEHLLDVRDDVVALDAAALLAEVAEQPGPFVQLWPHRHGTDAMFIAVLRRVQR